MKVMHRTLSLLVLCSLILAAGCSPTASPPSAPVELARHYAFDPGGNLETRTDANGATTHYGYDALNQLTAVQYPDGSAITYAYDSLGQRTEMKDALGITRYEYDIHNRLTKVADPTGQVLQYEYEPRGLLDKLYYPDGSAITFGWDENGQLISVQDALGITGYQYDLAGKVVRRTLPNGVISDYTYNAVNLLTKLEHKTAQGTLLLAFEYQYDEAGNRTQVTSLQVDHQPQVTRYTYDAVYRLTRVIYPDAQTVTYEYDALGNRVAAIPSGAAPTHYTYNNLSQLIQSDGPNGKETYQYDLNGNLTERSLSKNWFSTETTHYRWDYENRLIAVEAGATHVTFGYDGDGRRLIKTVNGQPTRYLQHGSALPQVLLATTGSQTTRSLLGQPRVGEVESQGNFFYLEDGLGSVVGIADSAGKLIRTQNYDAFGLPLNPEAGLTSFAYTGEEYDSETGLLFLRSRYYDASLGRFLSPDSVAPDLTDPQSFNRYTYVANNPLRWTDPQGTQFGPPPPYPNGNNTSNWITNIYTSAIGLEPSASNQMPSQVQSLAPYAGQHFDYVIAHSGGTGVAQIGMPLYGITADHVINLGGAAYPGATNIRGTNDFVPRILTEMGFSSAPYQETVNTGAGHLSHGYAEPHKIASYQQALNPILQIPPDARVLFVAGINTNQQAADTALQAMGLTNINSGSYAVAPYGAGFPNGAWNALQVFAAANGEQGFGGVWLDRVADVLVDLNDINGATFDPANGQLILIGRKDLSLPPMNPDNLMVALRSIYGGQEPSMSIEPCNPGVQDGCMKVLYNGRFQVPSHPEWGWVQYDSSGQLVQTDAPTTFGTSFGWTLFEADRYLKTASLGTDNISGLPFETDVAGFSSELDRMAANSTAGFTGDDQCLIRTESDRDRPSTCHRMWFVPGELVVKVSEDGQTMVFDPTTIVTQARFVRFDANGQMVDVPGDDPAVIAFVDFFNTHYTEFAREKKELAELIELAKIVGLVRWLHDNNIPVDLSWIDRYQVPQVETPLTTPSISAISGNVGLYGGVEFPTENSYVADNSSYELAEYALDSRPSLATTQWDFDLNGETLTAVPINLAPAEILGGYTLTRTDATLSMTGGYLAAFTRTYNSLDPTPGILGRGWSPVAPSLSVQQVPVPDDPNSIYTKIKLNTGLTQVEFTQATDGFFRPDDLQSPYQVTGLTGDDRFAPLGLSDEFQLIPGPPGQPPKLQNATGGAVQFSGFAIVRNDGFILSFDPAGRFDGLRDPAGNEIDYIYEQDHLTAIADPAGRTLQFAYDVNDLLASVTGSDGRSVHYEYNAAGDLVSLSTEAGVQIEHYAYDETGHLLQVTDGYGRILLENTYDELGRVLSSSNSQGYATGIQYEEQTNTTSYTDSNGNTLTREYDDQGRLVRETSPAGLAVTFQYDASDHLTRITDWNNNTVIYTYNDNGELVGVTSPSGGQTRLLNYNANGLPEVVISPANQAAFYQYDQRGHLTSAQSGYQVANLLAGGDFSYDEIDPLTVAYDYDPSGNLSAVQDAGGFFTRYTYDDVGNLTGVQLPNGGQLSLTLDDQAQVTALTDPLGNQISFSYDSLGQLSSTQTALGVVHYEYQAGRLVSITDPQNSTVQYRYDDAGRLNRVIDPAGAETAYEYEPAGNLAAIVDATGSRHEFQYDSLGRLIAEKWFLSETSASSQPRLAGAVLALLLLGAGLVIGLGVFVRGRMTGSAKCPYCGTRLSRTDEYCPVCGATRA